MNPDDAEFVINIGSGSATILKATASMEELKRKVPNIVNYYKEKTLLSLKSKAIKKEPKK